IFAPVSIGPCTLQIFDHRLPVFDMGHLKTGGAPLNDSLQQEGIDGVVLRHQKDVLAHPFFQPVRYRACKHAVGCESFATRILPDLGNISDVARSRAITAICAVGSPDPASEANRSAMR